MVCAPCWVSVSNHVTEIPVSETTMPVRSSDPEPGEASMLTGIVVPSTTHADARQANLDAGDVITKMATTMARRMCNQHGCTAPSGRPCRHPDHRRDVDYLRHVLSVLGLPGAHEAVTPEDREQLLVSLAHQNVDDLGNVEPSTD